MVSELLKSDMSLDVGAFDSLLKNHKGFILSPDVMQVVFTIVRDETINHIIGWLSEIVCEEQDSDEVDKERVRLLHYLINVLERSKKEKVE